MKTVLSLICLAGAVGALFHQQWTGALLLSICARLILNIEKK